MAEMTFPQLIQRACGIDVHLKVVVATIDGVDLERETRSFRTFTSSLNELKEWLLFNVTHVAMEIPGFSTKIVEDLVSEIGLDMSHFTTEKHLSS